MRCQYCGYRLGQHNPNCPKPGSVAMEIWQRGERDGRAGKELALHTLESYQLGWIQGNIALEEAQNGFDPRFDQA